MCVFIKYSPQGSGIYVEEEARKLWELEVMDNSKETASYRQNSDHTHPVAQRLW